MLFCGNIKAAFFSGKGFSRVIIIEGSLEVKLPTIWRDE
jgi:hypothetical protein